MSLTPTILIGLSKKKMNRLLHSKNEIYYYVINDSIRKVLCTLFDALGNISSRNDYYSFIKKYVQFKPFSTCNFANLLRHPLSIKQGIVIAIDNITKELYLPTQFEFDSISLYINYPTLIPQHKNDFIKDILEEHYINLYKKRLQNVLNELIHKSSMKFVLQQLIHKSLMKSVLKDIKNINYSKIKIEIEDNDYEDDFEIDFSEDVTDKLDESLDCVVDELKKVMELAKGLLPNAKPVYYPPTIIINKEENNFYDTQSQSLVNTPLDKSLPSIVEFIQFVEEDTQLPLETTVDIVSDSKELNEAVEEDTQLPLETTVDIVSDSKDILDEIEEISKEELEEEQQRDEASSSSTLVNELFQKYQKDTPPEVTKPEPPKSYLSSMWSYLKWRK